MQTDADGWTTKGKAKGTAKGKGKGKGKDDAGKGKAPSKSGGKAPAKGKGKAKAKARGGGGRPVLQNQQVAAWITADPDVFASSAAEPSTAAPAGAVGRGRPIPKWRQEQEAAAAKEAAAAPAPGVVGRGRPVAAWRLAAEAAQANPELATEAISAEEAAQEPAAEDSASEERDAEMSVEQWIGGKEHGEEEDEPDEGEWEGGDRGEDWAEWADGGQWSVEEWFEWEQDDAHWHAGGDWEAYPDANDWGQDTQEWLPLDVQEGHGVELVSIVDFHEPSDGQWLEMAKDEKVLLLHELREARIGFCKAHCRREAPMGYVPMEYLVPADRYDYDVRFEIKHLPRGLGLHLVTTKYGLMVLKVITVSLVDAWNKSQRKKDAAGLRNQIRPGDIITWIHNGLEGTSDIGYMLARVQLLDSVAKDPDRRHGGEEVKMFMTRHNNTKPVELPWDVTSEIEADGFYASPLEPSFGVALEIAQRTPDRADKSKPCGAIESKFCLGFGEERPDDFGLPGTDAEAGPQAGSASSSGSPQSKRTPGGSEEQQQRETRRTEAMEAVGDPGQQDEDDEDDEEDQDPHTLYQ